MAWLDDILGRTLVLVAHPDDECLAFGALLQRMREPLVVFATNGSPADPYFWQKYDTREAYAALRRQEALKSLHVAGVKDVLFLADMPGGVHLADQELFRNLRGAYELLADIIARRMVTALLTLAYEGGHPDHDACSVLAAQLARLASIPCWEAALYHRNVDGSGAFQEFVQASDDSVGCLLRRMLSRSASARCVHATARKEISCGASMWPGRLCVRRSLTIMAARRTRAKRTMSGGAGR